MSEDDYNRADLEGIALGLCNSNATYNHSGTLLHTYVNMGLQRLTSEGPAIEDSWTITAIVGKRGYVLPSGFLRAKVVRYNGDVMTYAPKIDHDFFFTGNGYPDRYAVWEGQLLLGPHPPATAYTITMDFDRSPLPIENDNATPEIPNRFRPALAYFAAAHMNMSDGQLQDYQVCMQQFEQLRKEYRQALLMKQRQEFPVVRRAWPY